MPRVTIHHDIEAVVVFETERCDYGVPRSPEWDEINLYTIEIESMSMFGRNWSEVDLRATFGDQGVEALRSLIVDNVEDWEDE